MVSRAWYSLNSRQLTLFIQGESTFHKPPKQEGKATAQSNTTTPARTQMKRKTATAATPTATAAATTTATVTEKGSSQPQPDTIETNESLGPKPQAQIFKPSRPLGSAKLNNPRSRARPRSPRPASREEMWGVSPGVGKRQGSGRIRIGALASTQQLNGGKTG